MAEGGRDPDLAQDLSDLDLGHGDTGGAPRRLELPWQDKLLQAQRHKQLGNDRYKFSEHKAAIGQYHRALLYLRGITKSQEQDIPFLPDRVKPDIPSDVLQEIDLLTIQCYNNLSACLLHSDCPNYDKVLQYCDNVLQVSPHNVKALYRTGVAAYHLKLPEEGVAALRLAASQPDGQKDSNIQKYLQLCEKAVLDQDRLMKDRYKAMFSA